MRANDGVAVGVLTNVGKTANSSLLKIDAWNVSVFYYEKRKEEVLTSQFASDWNTTKFVQ